MSGVEVLGIISAVIAIIDATVQVSHAIRDEAGLPPNFKSSAIKLPLITSLLEHTERCVEETADEEISSTITPVLMDCKEKATQLQQLFQAVIPAEGSPRYERYIKAARTIGKGGRVETLMTGLLSNIQLLTTRFPNLVTPRAQRNLTDAIEDMSNLRPSLPDGFEDGPTFVHYGSSIRNVNMGDGTQYINNSTGNQNNASGNQYIGTNHIVILGTEYLSDKLLVSAQENNFSVNFSLSEAPEIDYFVSRESELTEMYKVLSSEPSRRIVVLHGLGGIGKTQLAVAFMKRYRENFSAIFWINFKDKASIEQSFIKVAEQILQQHPNSTCLSTVTLQGDQDKVIEAVKAWLSLPGNTKWLLICDNYDHPQLPDLNNRKTIDINTFLPTSYHGSIIITSRLSQLEMGYRIPIKKLKSRNDSLKILSSVSGRAGLQKDLHAIRLAEKLDGLPLALAMAGAYLRRVSAASFADYLRLYETSWARLHADMKDLGSYKDRTLCSTWQISYEEIQKQNPLAAHLLQWWAYFDNEDIWFELLRPHPNDPLLPWRCDLSDELSFNSAMGTLHDYGFVEPHTLGENLIESRGYSIHSCLHSWAIHLLNPHNDNNLRRAALQCVASHIPLEQNTQFWLFQRRLMSHAVVVSGTITEEDGNDLHWACHNLGLLYSSQGKLQEAESMYLRALRGYEKTWGPDHISTLNTVNNLGLLYFSQRRLPQAEKMYLRALKGKEAAWGSENISTLDTINNLGILYSSQNKLQKAEELYLQALEGYQKHFGPNHPSTLNTVNNLGLLYSDQGKLQRAEDMYLSVLQTKTEAQNSDNTLLLDTIHNLGNLYSNQNKYQEAEKMYLHAFQEKEKIYGPGHTSTLDTLNSLGLLYCNQGRDQKAEQIFLQILQGYKKIWGLRHTSILDTQNNLGLLYCNQRKFEQAEDMYSKAFQGYQEIWGPDHISTLDSANSLGNLYSNQGKLEKAKHMYLHALRGYNKVLLPQNITTYRPAVNAMQYLGAIFERQGQLKEAGRYYENAYDGLRQILGPLHPDVQSLARLKNLISTKPQPAAKTVSCQASKIKHEKPFKKKIS